MKITCPHCSFEREINTNKIPAKSTVATCPKCSEKFTFRTLPQQPEAGELQEVAQAETQVQERPTEAKNQESSSEQKQENTSESLKEENKEASAENEFSENDSENAEEKIESDTNTQDLEKQEEDIENTKDTAKQEKDEELSDEEERIKKAHAFYREQMNKIKELEKDGYTIQLMTMVPWEDPQSKSNIVDKFVQTVVRSLFASPAFFTTMLRPFPISKAVLFYILIGIIQFVARMLTFRFNSNPDVVLDDANMQLLVDTLLEPSTLVLGLFIAPFVLILQLMFVSAVLTFIVKLVEPRSADFSLIVRIICYASAPGLLSLVPVLGDLLSMPWILFNIVVACRCALNISLPKTILTIFALILFIVLALLITLSAI